jgi:transposase-like protein
VVKHGSARWKQAFRCQECVHRFSPSAKRHVHPEKVRQHAVSMVCGGHGVQPITRLLGVNVGTVCAWIKNGLPKA